MIDVIMIWTLCATFIAAVFSFCNQPFPGLLQVCLGPLKWIIWVPWKRTFEDKCSSFFYRSDAFLVSKPTLNRTESTGTNRKKLPTGPYLFHPAEKTSQCLCMLSDSRIMNMGRYGELLWSKRHKYHMTQFFHCCVPCKLTYTMNWVETDIFIANSSLKN